MADSSKEIINEIDNKATEKLIECFNNNTIPKPNILCNDGKNLSVKIDSSKIENSIDILKNIMYDGYNNFEKKTGRKMTYSEMREAFG